MPESRSLLDRTFGLSQHSTNVRTEFIAGLTTFLTMVYIVFVNPTILGNAGMDKGAVFVATCIAAAVSTLVMAFYANYPIALAPGMGLNAFFAFTVVLTYKYTWQQALAAVFLLGCVVLRPVGVPHSRICHQCDSEEPQARDLRGCRAFPWHHRARAGQDCGREPGDAGDAWRPDTMVGNSLPSRLRADCGADLSPDCWWHPDWRAYRVDHRHPARARELF